MREVFAEPNRTIILGKQGENRAEKIIFNTKGLTAASAGGGDLELIIKDGSGTIKKISLEALDNGSRAELVITSDLLKVSGHGEMELKYSEAGKVVRSRTYHFEVLEALHKT